MGNPILLVQNAGFGETPVPADALLQPGADIFINKGEGDGPFERLAAKVLAVVPKDGCIEYAIADQNGQPRPLCVSDNTFDETLYVVDGGDIRFFIPHSQLLLGIARANAAGLNDEAADV